MAMFGGETGRHAKAAARNLAEVLTLHAQSLTANKWGRQ